jgi:hypothetical protein
MLGLAYTGSKIKKFNEFRKYLNELYIEATAFF